jgi:hypothetical protein
MWCVQSATMFGMDPKALASRLRPTAVMDGIQGFVPDVVQAPV